MQSLLLLVLSCPAARAATYYVATSGIDSNPGTLSAPFRTLQRGVNAAQAGDIILVQDGTYGPNGAGSGSFPVNLNKAGTAQAPITLKAEHPWGAVLDCQLTCHSYINFQGNSAWWVIQDFEIKNGWGGGIWANSWGAKNIVIRGNRIHHIGNRNDTTQIGIVGIYTDAGAQNFIVDGNVIHDVGRTNIYTNSFDHGVYSHGNLTIINNVFYNSRSGWHIQTASGFSGLIANNTFSGPNMYGSKSGQIMLWDADGSVAIRNNIFYNSRNTAITSYAFSSASCIIDTNIISGSGVTLGAPGTCAASNTRVNTDPLFVNPAGLDFHLLPTSPAIDAGVNLTAVPFDFNQVPRPQGVSADIGAFELAVSISPAPAPPTNLRAVAH